MEELSKPQGSGKNRKKPGQRVLDLGVELKRIRDELKGKMKEVIISLESLKKADEEIDWEKVGEGFFDVSWLSECIKEGLTGLG